MDGAEHLTFRTTVDADGYWAGNPDIAGAGTLADATRAATSASVLLQRIANVASKQSGNHTPNAPGPYQLNAGKR